MLDLSEIGTVRIDQHVIRLTLKEFEMLNVLVKAKGRTVTTDFIMNSLYGLSNDKEPFNYIVKVFACRLRKKLKCTGIKIIARTRIGYYVEVPEGAA